MPARLLLVAALLLPASAFAGVLYKSVGPNGTVTFSDVPPAEGAVLVEERRYADGEALPSPAPDLEALFVEAIADDQPLARANARVDLAEHALALARRGLWSAREGLRLPGSRMSRTDEERVEFYRRDLKLAQRELRALLRERTLAMR